MELQGLSHHVRVGLFIPGHQVDDNHQEGEMVVGEEGSSPVIVGGQHERGVGMASHCVNAVCPTRET